MAYKLESKYPSWCSYVLKLTSEAHPAALGGRLENLVTGVRHEFAAGAELLDLLAHDLARISKGLPTGANGGAAHE